MLHYANQLKVDFSQKELMRSSFLETDEPNYFFLARILILFSFLMAQIISNKDMKELGMLEKGIRAASNYYLTRFKPFTMKKNQNSSPGK